MTQLKYDPQTKKMIKDRLFEHLYNPVINHYNATLATIIDRNCLALGNNYKSFIYKGNTYKAETTTKFPRQMNRLVKQLHPEMDEYLTDVNHLNDYELPFVLGYINNVLNSSDSLQDYCSVFPESIHKPLGELIANSGCKVNHLSPQAINDMQIRNTKSIELMKKRMVLNLLL